MGVLNGLGRVWKRGSQRPASGPDAMSTGSVSTEAGEPNAILEIKPDDRPEVQAMRREIVEELRRNYGEVLGLVRKLDEHLDRQESRGHELMAMAERSERALEALPRIAEHTGEVSETSKAFAEAVGEHQLAMNDSVERQAGAIESHTLALSEFGRSVRESLGGMSDSTRELGDAILRMRETDRQRERELTDLVERTQRNQLAIVVGGVALVAATVLAVILIGVL